jgi:hypothetical protein
MSVVGGDADIEHSRLHACLGPVADMALNAKLFAWSFLFASLR